MNFYERQRDERARRAAGASVGAGLPCPNCGEIAAHWEAETLSTPGHYICDETTGNRR